MPDTPLSGDPKVALAGREVIFEYTQIGASVRVCAVDVATGIEVIVATPASAARMDQERLAMRKLARALGLMGPS